MQRKHEAAARTYFETQQAEERIKAEMARFVGQKPLHEKFAASYEQQQQKLVRS